MYRLTVVLPDGSGFERGVADRELIIDRGAVIRLFPLLEPALQSLLHP